MSIKDPEHLIITLAIIVLCGVLLVLKVVDPAVLIAVLGSTIGYWFGFGKSSQLVDAIYAQPPQQNTTPPAPPVQPTTQQTGLWPALPTIKVPPGP